MPDTFTANQGWVQQATGDTNWGVVLNTILASIDGLGAIGPLAVQTVEHPTSTSLNVKVSAGPFMKSDGTVVNYGGTTSVTMTASATNYLYLTDAGVLTVNTTGFPASTNIVRLATVVAGSSSITSITDARAPWASFGAQSPLYASAAANTAFMGPTSGSAAPATFRTFVDADLATTHAALTSTVSIFNGGFGIFRRVPGSYPYTVVAGDGWVEVDTTSARTVNLPAATAFSAGELVVMLDGNGHAGTNAISIAPHGTDTIDGSASPLAIGNNFGWAILYSDGVSNWHALTASGGSGYGTVTSVSNADGTLVISPTGGAVVASLNPNHANTWTKGQTIAPTSTTDIGLTVNAPLGTTVPVAEWQINGVNILLVSPTGSVVIGAGALSISATDGFLYVPTCAGVPIGTPTAETGSAGLIIDSADNRLYGNWGSGWVNLTPSVGSISVGGTTVSAGTSGYILYDNAGTLGQFQYVPPAHGGSGLDASGASNGQLLIGNGSGFSLATLTQGTGVTITNSPGGITIAASTSGMAIGGTISSATAKSVLFAGTAGVLAQDNANFAWDDLNVRLGLGTNAPNATLHANGSVQVKRVAQTSSYTVLGTDTYVGFNTSGAAATATLRSGTDSFSGGGVVLIADEGGAAATHAISLAASGGGSIVGPSSIAVNRGALLCVSDGSNNWYTYSLSPGSSTGLTVGTTTISSGTNGYILYDNAGVLGNVQYVPAANGGTGLSGAAAANGTLLIGNGSGYTLATLTAGTGIAITNSAGAITIARPGLTTDTDGATITFNLATSDTHTVTLAGNRTLAVSNDTVGEKFVIILKQDATGSRTVTWWSGILWPSGTAPTLTTTASKRDVFTFIKTASGEYLGAVSGQNY